MRNLFYKRPSVKIFLTIGCILISGCSSILSKKAESVAPIHPDPNLSLEEAQIRSRQISQVAYEVSFDFTGSNEKYLGSEKIKFQFHTDSAPLSSELRLDFAEGQVSNFRLNGQTVTVKTQSDGVRIPVALFKAGENRMEFDFEHRYSSDGRGLYRFVDPEDRRVYLFTDHEPFDANRTFPCFDQPDLKANFEVSVKAPVEWRVLANAPLLKVDHKAGIWKFKKSRKFSTYLFAIVAGDYAEWKSNAGGIPLRLWARQSLSPFVKAEEWFSITQKGLKMYGQEFSLPYPYEKYDQIIAPDFQAGAMENPGAVLFSERFVSRGQMTLERRRGRADVILHEMAHMWFGDWVTMRWWNDLWLNESFATFMSYEMLQRIDPASAAFATIRVKPDAYLEDQLQITHPIEGNVQNTMQAMGQFDAITYEKGSSTLKQLRAFLGAEKFRKGLVSYFKKYAESNATLADFISEMSKASGKDISLWQREWLQRSGFNTLQGQPVCENGNLAGIRFDQGAGPRPRLFHVKFLPSMKSYPIEMEQSIFEWKAPAKTPCPESLIMNSGDLDFFRWLPTHQELGVLKQAEPIWEDQFDRLILIQALYDSFIQSQIGEREFVEYGLGRLLLEKDAGVQKYWVSKLWTDADFESETAIESVSAERKLEIERKLEAIFLHQWSAEKDSDRGLFALDLFLKVAQSPYGLSKVDQLVLGKIPADWDRRWAGVRQLCRRGYLQCRERVAYLRSQDHSERARKNAIVALAQWPESESKNQWYRWVLGQSKSIPELGEVTPLELVAAASSLGRNWDVGGFIRDVDTLLKLTDSHYVRLILSDMTPFVCKEGSAANRQLREWAETLPAHLKKGLLRQWELAERCGKRAMSNSK